ncbi:MAG: filamentous hemagglutinin N-terminal domain-containing protein [Candidatus Omnitrophica bacterium]|nr:filamentous hemagglutinin N-terminal domain-containing protein [Candidatus Omnitrophota bacterium]
MKRKMKKVISLVVAICFSCLPQAAYALPQGEVVVDGAAGFDRSVANELTVKQTTDKLIADYDAFSIAVSEKVIFDQPSTSSVALNRVVGIDPSLILGKLKANGRLFLINPNGIVFGEGSKVDVAGLVASTLDIDNDDFLAGRYNFFGQGGTVLNYGELLSPGGFVALLGSSVRNAGIIKSNLGSVALAAGEAVTLDLDPQGLISVVVNEKTTKDIDNNGAAVINTGFIEANGGEVILTAKSLSSVFDQAINNTGIIEAVNLEEATGHIALLADEDIHVGNTVTGGYVEFDSSDGNVTHLTNSQVTTDNENFRGSAGKDYILKNAATITTGEGVIDIYAEDNILLGSADDETVINYEWDYILGTRGYHFTEFGYYYDDGNGIVYVPLAKGSNIGKHAHSPSSGSGLIYDDRDSLDLYTVSRDYDWKKLTWHDDPALNSDGEDHLVVDGIRYQWEDLENLGDRDFDDEVFDFAYDIQTFTTGAELNSRSNVFLTANKGSIHQNGGNITADNLMLSANTGISGTSANKGLDATVNALSALNKTANSLALNIQKAVKVADLRRLSGINNGVAGSNGVENKAACAKVDIKVAGDLDIMAPVVSHGDIILEADGSITQSGDGDITIVRDSGLSLNPPSDLGSPSHQINVPSENDTIEVVWGLPECEDGGCGDLTSTAGGAFTQDEGTKIATNGGDATVEAQDDIRLALIDAGDGHAKVTSHKGSILDNDLGVVPGDYDVIARNIKLAAAGQIGGSGDQEEIDLGQPGYGFSRIFDMIDDTDPDISIDDYTVFLDSNGDWRFTTAYKTTQESDNWWFHVATVGESREEMGMSETAHLGPFVIVSEPPPTPGIDVLDNIFDNFRVYYEILSPSRFVSFEPSTKIGLYAYHPIVSTDESAFDDIRLDVDAYEFIERNINLKGPLSPYFDVDEEDKK